MKRVTRVGLIRGSNRQFGSRLSNMREILMVIVVKLTIERLSWQITTATTRQNNPSYRPKWPIWNV